jgi:putative hydrolase of the HAD superfamily
MGVIYSVGNDVRDLLCPFIEEKGGTTDTQEIDRLYQLASLGKMTATELWEAIDLDPALEDEYLQRHKITDGLIAFLEAVNSRGYQVWCLSNDISEWSKKLRVRFELESYFRGFVISGDVGLRKPDQTIYEHLLQLLNTSPGNAAFVDDHAKNLDSAAALGFNTILFTPYSHDLNQEKHLMAPTFDELLSLLT